MMKLGIVNNTLDYYRLYAQEPHGRHKSWEHCYLHFRGKRLKSKNDFDNAALHLAFYLASWGMYRGSSQIFHKDYKIHIPVVRVLVSPKYEALWSLDCDSLQLNDPSIGLIFKLAEDVRKALMQNGITPTPTLTTKIIMGTAGCVPAYDRNFVAGVKRLGKFPASFGSKSYGGIVQFYQEHADEFKEAQAIIAKSSFEYPPMKLVDMYFLRLGKR